MPISSWLEIKMKLHNSIFFFNFFFIRKINSKMNNFEFLVGHTRNEVNKANIGPKKMNFINRKSGALFFLNFVLIEILDSRHTLEDWHKNEKHCILPSVGSVMKTKLTHIFKHLFGLLLILFCVSFGISLGFYALQWLLLTWNLESARKCNAEICKWH